MRLAHHLRALLVLLAICLLAPAYAAADGPKKRIVVTGSVVVERGDTAGDVIVVDGDVLVRGTVDGRLVVVDGTITLRGRVTGDVVAVAGNVVFGERGRVDGDLYYGDKAPTGAAGKVRGDVEKIDANAFAGIGFVLGFWLAVTVSAFLLGLLLLLLAPRAADAVARVGRAHPGRALLVGLLTFIVLPVLAAIAFVTVVGIPLAVGLLLILPPLLAIAYVTTAWILGRRILSGKARILAFIVGLLLLRLLALIPIVGGLVWFFATLFGLGALIVALLRARKA